MINPMTKPADREELMRQIKSLPLEERELIAAELLEGIHDEGGAVDGDIESDPKFLKELERRADAAIAHPERGFSREDAVASARAAVEAVRARKG